MLKQRIITALILAPLVIWAILALPANWFALLIGVVALGGFWEWSAFVTSKVAGRMAYLLVGGGLLSVLYFLADAEVWNLLPWLGIGWLLFASLLVIRYPKISSVWQKNKLLKVIVGLLILIPMWASVVEIQRSVGAEFVLLLMLLIWGADTGAYFTGRAWGKNKLSPAVSPGKSWEGVFGGLLVSTAVALIASNWLELSMSVVLFVGIALVVSAVSVMGDLIESLFKRITGIKDSGNILPGHGGVLDRIDSLTTAAPVFYLAMSYLG